MLCKFDLQYAIRKIQAKWNRAPHLAYIEDINILGGSTHYHKGKLKHFLRT
jgi:hypothetical protein